MSELLIPGRPEAEEPETPFDRYFFMANFHSAEPPACELYSSGEIPVLELELTNGETPDVYYFEAFRKQYLVALLFVDPPQCDQFYRTFIRYETIYRVNIRYYDPPTRMLGFKASVPLLDEEELPSAGPPLA